MALVERLMDWQLTDESRRIPVHDFFAACQEIIAGRLTSAQVQTYLAMDAADLADWNAVVATIPPQNQTANRALWVNGMHSIFLLAEGRVPGYSTPAEVRLKLGI